MTQIKYDFNPFSLTGESSAGIGDKDRVFREIAEFIRAATIERTQSGVSPVSGRGKFKQLSKDYAEAKKDGDRTPDLTLEDEMLESIDVFKLKGNTMRITLPGEQQPKADGHNNFSGDSRIPERRFIPNEKDGETFKNFIIDGIASIIREAKGQNGSSNTEQEES